VVQDEYVPGGPVRLVDVAEVQGAADDVVSAFAADFSALVGGEIHHIGATALPFGRTKGDVDVNVRAGEADFPRVVDALSARLAIAQPENWTATFASFSADGYALPLGVQVTVIGSSDDFLLALRDRLLRDPELLRRYDEAKRASAGAGPAAYWRAKDDFFRRLRAS
jgi:GrpB-like predicted nucleotidyltransferase (UPF0157 family)